MRRCLSRIGYRHTGAVLQYAPLPTSGSGVWQRPMDGMVARNLNEGMRRLLHPDEHERLQRRLQHRRLRGEQDAASDWDAAAKLSGELGRLGPLRELLTKQGMDHNSAGRMWWSPLPTEPPESGLWVSRTSRFLDGRWTHLLRQPA